MPLSPGKISPRSMDDRQWATFVAGAGVQADAKIKTFTPTWFGFSSDPTGTLSYLDFGAIVYVWTDADRTGVSDDTLMVLAGVPEAIRPSGDRYVRCLLLDESSLRGGVARLNSVGQITFFLEQVEAVPTDSIGFAHLFTNPSTLGYKGLPIGWMIQYVK